MNLKPLRDRVVVKPHKAEEKTAGGIILPETSTKDNPKDGEVIAVGTGRRSDKGESVALEVKQGDSIVFSEYAGTEVKIDGEKYLIMREEDILAIR